MKIKQKCDNWQNMNSSCHTINTESASQQDIHNFMTIILQMQQNNLDSHITNRIERGESQTNQRNWEEFPHMTFWEQKLTCVCNLVMTFSPKYKFYVIVVYKKWLFTMYSDCNI